MDSVDIITGSGAAAVISAAPFKDAMALKNALWRELATAGIKIDELSLKTDFKKLFGAFLIIDSSENFNKNIMTCLARCTYNEKKIVESTFETESAREDYYQLAFECLKVNLNPFAKGLISKLKALGALTPESPSQPSK